MNLQELRRIIREMLSSDNPYNYPSEFKDVVVYDKREFFDRYTIFTPDGSVYGMSKNPDSPQGLNMYLGDNTEIEMGPHLGKRLKMVPEELWSALLDRMKNGLSEQLMMEGLFSNIMKAVRNSSGPWAVIVAKSTFKDGKSRLSVVEQDINIKNPDLLPASYQVMKKKYPSEKVYIEDATGTVIWKDWN